MYRRRRYLRSSRCSKYRINLPVMAPIRQLASPPLVLLPLRVICDTIFEDVGHSNIISRVRFQNICVFPKKKVIWNKMKTPICYNFFFGGGGGIHARFATINSWYWTFSWLCYENWSFFFLSENADISKSYYWQYSEEAHQILASSNKKKLLIF